MPPWPKSNPQLLMTSGLLIFLLLGAHVVRGGDEASMAEVATTSRVGVYETTVTVRSKVECRKYEGRVLYCTVNPLRAVRDVLETRLILGYATISINGDAFDVAPLAGGDAKFYPRGDRYRKDYSGEQELTLAVVHVK